MLESSRCYAGKKDPGVCVWGAVIIEILNTRLPWWLSGKESTCQRRRHRFHP